MIAEEFAYNPTTVDRAIEEHIARGVSISECLFRPGSESFLDFYNKVRTMTESMDLCEDDLELLETDIGQTVVVDGQTVMLDVPYVMEAPLELDNTRELALAKKRNLAGRWAEYEYDNMDERGWIYDRTIEYMDMEDSEWAEEFLSRVGDEWKGLEHFYRNYNEKGEKLSQPIDEAEYQGKKVELNKPKRGGSKKFYVYVKDGDKVKKVSFGAKDGGGNLAVKLRDPEARKNFAARHNCPQKNDKTSAGYWSCRLPRYAKSLGLSGGGTWW